MLTTSLTLLDRLRRPDDHAAWEQFVRLYAPLLLSWARRQGWQDADADDLAQDVLIKLIRLLPTYECGNGQSFRGWLRTVTVNQARDFRRRKATRQLPSTGEDRDVDVAVESGLGFEEAEYRQALVARGLELIRPEITDSTWAAFEEFMIRNRSVDDVAASLGVSVNAVYMARHRVLARLRQELDGLLD